MPSNSIYLLAIDSLFIKNRSKVSCLVFERGLIPDLSVNINLSEKKSLIKNTDENFPENFINIRLSG